MTPHRRLEVLRSIKDIFAQAALAWMEHDASTMGAALAFYTVFSVAPILIIAIGVFGLVIGDRHRSRRSATPNAKFVW
jgi:membrane protein